MLKRIAPALLFFCVAVAAHAQMAPYYGKNAVKYDTFKWKTYKSTHFEFFFYQESEAHLQRVASMAESAYDKISATLQHDIEFRIPLIFFKTQSEFEQVNYLQVSEGILGVAEPVYNRMAFAIDLPSDELQELILHELTHVFEFSMLFGGMLSPIVRQAPPLWVMEGFAEYTTGVWNPTDLMVVRDAVLTEKLPFLSVTQDMLAPGGVELGRAPYNIGHAAFEFMREKYGEAGIRQFWFYMKKATLLGSEDVIYSAFGVKEETFNEQFAHYLREKMNDFRDKQSPIDYGKEVALPKKYKQIFSHVPSPDGKEFAVMTANYSDQEFDILKINREGKVLDSLTGGTTTSYQYLTTDSFSFEGRNISWSANGQRIAFFARTGKRRSLFVYEASSGKRIKRIDLKIDQAASPALSADGGTVVITGLLDGKPDLFLVDIQSEAITNVTNNQLYEKTPNWSPDGKYIYYTSRIKSRDQIMRLNAANPKEVEQLTFSEYNSAAPYYDAQTNSVFYSADKNSAFNIYKLDLNTGDKIQYTDVIGSNFSPVVFRGGEKNEVAFITFFKGQYRFFIMDLPNPVTVIAKGTETKSEDTLKTPAEQLIARMGVTPGQAQASTDTSAEADYKPTKQINIDAAQVKPKKFRAILSGRPQVITGVSGDTFAVASGIAIQDILGDQEFRFFISRIRGFQSYNAGYLDLGHRLQFLTDFIWNDDFFIAPLPAALASLPDIFPEEIVRDRIYGGRFIGQYPLNLFYRVELGAGIFHISQEFIEPIVQQAYDDFIQRTGSVDFLNDGGYLPLSFAFVGETTRFREFGPLSGSTFRVSVDYAPPVKDTWVSRVIYEVDLRKYFRLSDRALVAVRGRGFGTDGDDLVIFSFGGGQDVRGFDFREIVGNKGGIVNTEFRFPLWPNPRMPLLGQLRGKVFVDYFRTSFNEDLQISASTREVNGLPFTLDFKEGAGAFGIGFTVFAGGLPFNFDFSKVYGQGRPLFSIDPDEPTTFEVTDGINFDFSIGYDF